MELRSRFFACLLGLSLAPASAGAADWVPVTLLHTNDLHSHLRRENTPLGLGGVARLKTEISRLRSQIPNTLLVDGGDWSEGNIYYLGGAGVETLKTMDFMGYDVAVVGNHDWLNGAGTLLDVVEQANPAMKVVATNITTSGFDREDEFRRRIPPYVIQEVGGVKIAFIGLLTYEFIYDKFLKPITIDEPFAVTRELAKRLKKQADAVVVISHNSIKLNQGVLEAAPDVDLVIGAHDHVKLTQPVVVNRAGHAPAWIVETGCWGRYLGRVDLKILPRDPANPDSVGQVQSVSYGLTQMDSTIPEDPEALRRIASLEAVIESRKGPVFHDHVGDSELELARDGQESLMGDFTTDAYLAATNADLAIDQTNLIYNSIHEGPVTTADVFNSNPGVYSPVTDKAWTLSVVPVQGKTLSWLLNLLYSSKALSQQGALDFAGADIVYKQPFGLRGLGPSLPSQGDLSIESLLNPPGLAMGISISSLKIRGEELQPDRTYWLAAPGGVMDAIRFLNGLLPGTIPLDQSRETGLEDWRVMADHLSAHSPLTDAAIPYGRVHTSQPDLGVLYDDVRWEPLRRASDGRVTARVHVRIRNTGMQDSPAGSATAGPRLQLLENDNGVNYAVEPSYRDAAAPQGLPAIPAGGQVELSWDTVALPRTLGLYALTARIVGNDGEVNHSNDEVTRYFQFARGARPPLAGDR